MTERELFVAVHGQDDNVGDPVLRRAMQQDLAPSMTRHVLVGAASSAYMAALQLRPDDIVYRARGEWQRAAMSMAARGRASYVSNAGEIQLNPRRRSINRADAALLTMIRLGGGIALTTGLGVRRPEAPRSRVLSYLGRVSNLAVWRDGASRDYVGHGTVAPDWAFALGDGTEDNDAQREAMVVSMRGDVVPPGAEWVAALRGYAGTAGLRLQTVTQVGRDDERSRLLADELVADHEPWQGSDHRAAEEGLRSIYRRSHMVVSDRLHVLILAATEGAVPVYCPVAESTKVPRTLRPVGLDYLQVDVAALGPDETVRQLTEYAKSLDSVRKNVRLARDQTSALKNRMNAVLEGAVA